MVIQLKRKSLLRICVVVASLPTGVQAFPSRPFRPHQASASADNPLREAEQRFGPFAIGEQPYTLILHEKTLGNVTDPALVRTLSKVEIVDAAANTSYERNFSSAIENGRFQRTISASAQLMSGATGSGIVILYRETTAPSQTSPSHTTDSWQLFGVINGKFTLFAKPAPIGEGVAGGPYMGTAMKATNGQLSVISQPDTIELRAWAGNFYVFVPLRVDWNHGGLAQGQRCMEMIGGGLKEDGCDMRVESVRKPPADEYTFARLFVEANEGMGMPEHVVIQKTSKVEILGSSAITSWVESEELAQPVFSDIWLHVRIDDRTGWIHGEEDFAAVGLSAGSPAR
jgi:hypothetical protein